MRRLPHIMYQPEMVQMTDEMCRLEGGELGTPRWVYGPGYVDVSFYWWLKPHCVPLRGWEWLNLHSRSYWRYFVSRSSGLMHTIRRWRG